jgi:hypothetical protein
MASTAFFSLLQTRLCGSSCSLDCYTIATSSYKSPEYSIVEYGETILTMGLTDLIGKGTSINVAISQVGSEAVCQEWLRPAVKVRSRDQLLLRSPVSSTGDLTNSGQN